MNFAIIFLTAESTISQQLQQLHYDNSAMVYHLANFLVTLLIVLAKKSLSLFEMMVEIHHR